EVRVEAVLVRSEVEHAQPHLLRRAERLWGVRPAGGIDRCHTGERGLAGESGGMVELDAERGDEVRGVVRRDVVRRHATTGMERAEVDRRALDRRLGAARVLELHDLLATAFGRLADRLRLGHTG